MRRTIIVALAVSLLALGCDESNPFRNTTPLVLDGSGQVWELALEGFPSGWILSDGLRFFVGTASTPSNGSWVLDAESDGTLVLRPFDEVVPGLSVVNTAIQDLTETQGVQTFEAARTVPESGYADGSVEVVEGHVYAMRITTLGGIVVPVNYAKIEIVEVGREFPDDPASRWITFRWAYQRQPLNRDLVVEE